MGGPTRVGPGPTRTLLFFPGVEQKPHAQTKLDNLLCPWILQSLFKYRKIFVIGYIEPDEMCHVSSLLVHSSLYLITVKKR